MVKTFKNVRRSMAVACRGFNLYLLALSALILCGCETGKKPKGNTGSTIAVHLEGHPDGDKRTEEVSIGRSGMVKLNIELAPFLDQGLVREVKVIDNQGGFALRVEFIRQGAWLLEEHSVADHGKRLAIFSRFVTPPGHTLNDGRWIAAPMITHRISDGILEFTPDTTREEAEAIAAGLNNVAKKLENDPTSKWHR